MLFLIDVIIIRICMARITQNSDTKLIRNSFCVLYAARIYMVGHTLRKKKNK